MEPGGQSLQVQATLSGAAKTAVPIHATNGWQQITIPLSSLAGANKPDLDGFWTSLWEFFDVAADGTPEAVVASRDMPGAEWFSGVCLNYAEHAAEAAIAS